MLKIDIKNDTVNRRIVGTVLEQDERDFRFKASNGIIIKSEVYPQLYTFNFDNIVMLFIRGKDKDLDKESFKCYISSATKRAGIHNNIIDAVKEYNESRDIENKVYNNEAQDESILIELYKIQSMVDGLINNIMNKYPIYQSKKKE